MHSLWKKTERLQEKAQDGTARSSNGRRHLQLQQDSTQHAMPRAMLASFLEQSDKRTHLVHFEAGLWLHAGSSSVGLSAAHRRTRSKCRRSDSQGSACFYCHRQENGGWPRPWRAFSVCLVKKKKKRNQIKALIWLLSVVAKNIIQKYLISYLGKVSTAP